MQRVFGSVLAPTQTQKLKQSRNNIQVKNLLLVTSTAAQLRADSPVRE